MPSELVDIFTDPRVGAAAIVGPALLYKVWQILNQDKRRNRQDDNADQFYKDLQEQHKTAIERADKMTQERNDALLGQKQAEFQSNLLQERVDNLKKQLAETEALLQHYKTVIESLTQRNEHLSARVELMEARPPPILVAPTTPSGVES